MIERIKTISFTELSTNGYDDGLIRLERTNLVESKV